MPVPPDTIMEDPRVSQRLPMRLSGSFAGSKWMRSRTETMVAWSSSLLFRRFLSLGFCKNHFYVNWFKLFCHLCPLKEIIFHLYNNYIIRRLVCQEIFIETYIDDTMWRSSFVTLQELGIGKLSFELVPIIYILEEDCK